MPPASCCVRVNIVTSIPKTNSCRVDPAPAPVSTHSCGFVSNDLFLMETDRARIMAPGSTLA